MSLKRPHPSSVTSVSALPHNSTPQTIPSLPNQTIYTTLNDIYDRKSTFKAFYSPNCPPRDLQKQLRSYDSTANADHYILAWRIPKPPSATIKGHFAPTNTAVNTNGQPKVYDTGFDDDGEKYGGKEVLKLLEQEKVEGACVVVRFYGGVMLGPVRFAHMYNVARDAVREGKRALGMSIDNGEKRVKMDEGLNEEQKEEEKRRLVEDLQERDGNIEVLRGSLREIRSRVERMKKKKKDQDPVRQNKESEERANGEQGTSSAKKKTDYAAMDLEMLKRLDKARDATVAVLLKGIDEAEEEEKKLKEEKGLVDKRPSVDVTEKLPKDP